MTDVANLAARLEQRFAGALRTRTTRLDEVTVELEPARLIEVCTALRDEPEFAFECLMDLCGVDYFAHGLTEWTTADATDTGFGRGVDRRLFAAGPGAAEAGRRFAVVYHLLSVSRNARLRLRVFAEDDDFPVVDSVCDVWSSADWYEREAFDLFGIVFDGHPDLRRILTDYGFIGHPFRKDFPLSGHVEMRYDADQRRVIYEPVSIEPRVLVPRVIRHDHRYDVEPPKEAGDA
jgi:NADH-quinone oxidoreductase subunit C